MGRRARLGQRLTGDWETGVGCERPWRRALRGQQISQEAWGPQVSAALGGG